jgi:hypothetical protein
MVIQLMELHMQPTWSHDTRNGMEPAGKVDEVDVVDWGTAMDEEDKTGRQ